MRDDTHGNVLKNRRILIVEDRFLLADDMQRLLTDSGAEVLGPAATIEAAERLIGEGGVDAAMLDIDLHGESVFALADLLEARDVPYVFVTGFHQSSLPARYAQRPYLSKPISPKRLLAAVVGLLAGDGETE